MSDQLIGFRAAPKDTADGEDTWFEVTNRKGQTLVRWSVLGKQAEIDMTAEGAAMFAKTFEQASRYTVKKEREDPTVYKGTITRGDQA